MIYLDSKGHADTDVYPVDRQELCLNCGKNWGSHSGWGCNNKHASWKSSREGARYLTQSMKDNSKKDVQGRKKSTSPSSVKALGPEKDITDWRNWVTTKADECPCGTRREVCVYHR